MLHRGRKNADPLLLTALAFGATAEAAAQKAGVGVATVHRRLKDPEFSRRLQQLRAVLEIGLKQREAGELTQRIPEFINQIAEAIVEPDPSTESRESTGCRVARSRLVRVPGVI